MKDVNKIILIGRLGHDPVRRETKNGLAVVQFSLATSRRVGGGEEGTEAKEETMWHRIVVWGRQAEACQAQLVKGQMAFIEGNLRSHKYTGKDGLPKLAFEVHAENVIFLARSRRRPEDGLEAAGVSGVLAAEVASAADAVLAEAVA